jgi:hypothetical protein
MRLIAAFVPFAAVILVACAGGPPGPGGPPPGGRFAGPQPGMGGGLKGEPTVLFISPCGEPFRGRPGEPYPVAAWFAQADTNHNGQLNRAEFIADATRFFAVLDRNRNGQIDSDELSHYEQVVAPEILAGPRMGAAPAAILKAAYGEFEQMGGASGGGMGGGPGGGGPPGGGGGRLPPPGGGPPKGGPSMAGAAPYGLLREPEPVAASNLSFGGRISFEDFHRRADQRFDWLDAGKKGYLELATLPKTMVQQMARPGGGGRLPS